MFNYFEREGDYQWGMGQRERERGKERIPSSLHAVSTEPNLGLELMSYEIMT